MGVKLRIYLWWIRTKDWWLFNNLKYRRTVYEIKSFWQYLYSIDEVVIEVGKNGDNS